MKSLACSHHFETDQEKPRSAYFCLSSVRQYYDDFPKVLPLSFFIASILLYNPLNILVP